MWRMMWQALSVRPYRGARHDARREPHALRRRQVLPQPPRTLPQLFDLGLYLLRRRRPLLRLEQPPPRLPQLLLQRDDPLLDVAPHVEILIKV